jgi:hypothetical protein
VRCALAGADDEAEQPEHEDRERDPPQDVDGEAQAAKDHGEQENEQDDCHDFSFQSQDARLMAAPSGRLPWGRPLNPPNDGPRLRC